VACAEDDGDFGPQLEKLSGHLNSGNAGHGMIGDDKIKPGRSEEKIFRASLASIMAVTM